MAAKQQHIIRQLSLEFNTPAQAEQDYHALAERLSLLGAEHIPAIIDKVLSDLVPADTYVRYDKIELNCELERWDDLEMVIRQQLAEQLETIVEKQRPNRQLPSKVMSSDQPTGKGAFLGPAAWVLHFLQHGFLPWSAPRDIDRSGLSYELTELLASDKYFAQVLFLRVSDDPRMLQRLAQQFGAVMLVRLLEAQGVMLSDEGRKKMQEEVATYAKGGPSFLQQFWRTQLAKIQSKPSESIEEDSRLPQINSTEKQSAPTRSRPFHTAQSERAEQAVYLNNAGLVLLHPFMNRFLQLHDTVTDKEVLDANLAAALLQSLVTGQNTAAEWELVLPKVLLGQALTQPLTTRTLNPEQLASGEELINAAIQHWSSLGTTSVEGFRSNFLQREGMLTARGNDWQLTVQKAPYDMLLDTLPWGISLIKLPWMEGVLQVDWG